MFIMEVRDFILQTRKSFDFKSSKKTNTYTHTQNKKKTIENKKHLLLKHIKNFREYILYLDAYFDSISHSIFTFIIISHSQKNTVKY